MDSDDQAMSTSLLKNDVLLDKGDDEGSPSTSHPAVCSTFWPLRHSSFGNSLHGVLNAERMGRHDTRVTVDAESEYPTADVADAIASQGMLLGMRGRRLA